MNPNHQCSYCENARDIKLKPCANGDKNLSTNIVSKGIVIFNFGEALGYFDITFCPMCGARLKKVIK